MAVATHLADKSALARMGNEAVARRLGPMIEAGLVGTCGIIELEVGQLRAVRFPDLLIAATAERHGLVVIHYDADYDLIARVTDQRCEWVVPQGSVP